MSDPTWTIVAFDHPRRQKSILYRQNLHREALLKAVEEAIEGGANLMSIRGFPPRG